jgi:hypothetical protein
MIAEFCFRDSGKDLEVRADFRGPKGGILIKCAREITPLCELNFLTSPKHIFTNPHLVHQKVNKQINKNIIITKMFHVRQITFYGPRESSELLQDLVANLSVTTIFIG